ncbi:septation protein SepH [Psychromicrobium xiongbiense]|uniref:septation protein SepH n=1 Tax=Psychromicrobium xiongbiense TaxID=3051184 RepID=UPI002556877E|nr:septation protein SepH [Psychromicrobium sp. YIM S02556]
MQDLRLLGVHDDGTHLLLSAEGGEIYRLRIDEALRVASSRTPGRFSPVSTTPATETSLSPRDIQQRIRAGASAEEVAEATGLSVEHIRRYESPILAEREHIAQRARAVEVSEALPHHDGYRSAFGDQPASLAEMVSYRLSALGIDSETVRWDAWRRSDGQWTVIAEFPESAAAAQNVGETGPAQWIFNTTTRSLTNANRWAQVLSEMGPVDSPLPARRLSAVADRPFDVEAEAAPEEDISTEEESSGSDNLLELLRSRRGQRLGIDEDNDETLALMLTEQTDRTVAESSESEESSEEGDTESGTGRLFSFFPPLSVAPSPETGDSESDDAAADQGSEDQRHEDKTETSASTASDDGALIDRPEGTAEEPAVDRRNPIRPKRSSIPSWDQIVFGTKTD